MSRELQQIATKRARRWLSEHFDAETREAVGGLLDLSDPTELINCFGAELEFGTAGLRGILGAGTTRMNIYTVAKAAFGVARALVDHHPEEANRGIVVGYDCRHMSPEFAAITARAITAQGLTCYLFDTLVGTPLVPYTVRRLNAGAGIMVTSSHNPKEYNGFKVYTHTGVQIVSPVDSEIAQAMSLVEYGEVPLTSIESASKQGLLVNLGEDARNSYIDWAAKTASVRGETDVKIAYSPLGGTGYPFVSKVLEKSGFTDVHVVEAERDPDPEFAGLKGPNPERPDSWARTLQLAKEIDADIALATDGDADRIGAAVRTGVGEYQLLKGNQIGTGMLYYLLLSRQDAGTLTGKELAICSVVSSPLTKKVAEGFGGHFQETLTGFKWMGSAAEELSKQGLEFLFAFEEAFGVTFGESRDKDGVTAVALLAEMQAWAQNNGRSLLDLLDDMYVKFGLHWEGAAEKHYEGLDGQTTMEKILDHLRNNPPKTIAGSPVVRVRDLWTLTDKSGGESRQVTEFPKQNLLTFWSKDGSWISIRPSGTEPKIKAYVGTVFPATADTVKAVQRKASQHVAKIEAEAAAMLEG